MLSTLTRFTTADAFNAVLLATIRESENAKPNMYLDNATPQNPTIGIGFNLTNLTMVRAVLVGLGYVSGSKVLEDDARALQAIFRGHGAQSTMQTEADKIISATLGAGRTFAFPSGAAGDAAMNSVFFAVAPEFTQMVVTQLNSLGAPGFSTDTWSRELIALTSMAFNAPKLIGQGLANAIRDDNRALAWYEIRFGSNKNRDFGLQNRRDRESNMFGLFDTGAGSSPPSLQAAKDAYRVFTARYKKIDDYLKGIRHSTTPTGYMSAAELQAARNAFSAALQPAKEVLVADLKARYVIGTGTFQADEISATKIYLDPNRDSGGVLDARRYDNSNPDGGGVELEFNDLLIGEGGDEAD